MMMRHEFYKFCRLILINNIIKDYIDVFKAVYRLIKINDNNNVIFILSQISDNLSLL